MNSTSPELIIFAIGFVIINMLHVWRITTLTERIDKLERQMRGDQ